MLFFLLLFQLIGKISAYYATIIGSNPGQGVLRVTVGSIKCIRRGRDWSMVFI